MGWHTGPPIPMGKWRAFRRQIFDRDGWRCQRCGKAGRLECHHPKPVSAGGAVFDPDNAKTYCRKCHLAHHRKTPENPERKEWRKLIARFG